MNRPIRSKRSEFVTVALCAILLTPQQALFGESLPRADFSLPGELSITLEPAGGLWQIVTEKDGSGNWVVDDGTWRTSGDVATGLAAGRYAVVFQSPEGYAVLDPVEVEVFGGSTVTRAASFREITVYTSAAAIPPQYVRIGDTLEFRLEEPASLSGFEPHPTVERDIRFDGRSFSYRPTAVERAQFEVTFSALGSDHTVLVTPQPRLPAETSVLEYRGDFLPVEASAERKAYLTVIVEERTRSAEEGPLNLRSDRNARSVTISGPRVAFARGHSNDLWENFSYDETEHPVDDIESLTVYADQVVISGPLRLPETDVTIFARELIFDDADEEARLITTPLKAPGRAMNGIRGHDAGGVELLVASVRAPGNITRVVVRGGDGQEPVEGRNGAPISSPKIYATYKDTFTVTCFPLPGKKAPAMPDRTIYYKVDECCAGCRKKWERGTSATPRSGNNASRNGVPGNAGNGGVLTCPFDLQEIADVRPGTPGESQPKRFGSAGDRPYNAVKVYTYYNCVCDWDSWSVTRMNNVAGTDQPATSPPGPDPVAGEVRIQGQPFAWLHPVAVRSLLAFAKDVYLNGYPDETRALLVPYAEALRAHTDRPPETAAALDQLEDEIATLLHRIDSHLDFFGFPAGWVPMLSFEVTLALFQDEVEAAGDILYLSHYLSLEASKAVNKAAALDRMRSELAEEIREFQGRLDATKERINVLSIRARAVEREISEIRTGIEFRETELRNQAELNAGLKKAFRVAGNTLPLIPVGQPALGLAGAGFTAASKFNEQSALDSSIEATNLAHVFLEQHMDQQLEDFETAMCTNQAECAVKGAFLAQQRSLQGFDAGMVAVNQTLREAQTWESDVDAEVQLLAAQDPRHKDLVKRIKNLNEKKKRFAEEMVVALQEAMKLTSGINQNSLALGSLNRDAVKNSARIDQEAFSYIREMGQRAKARLLKFQYYLVKAYHYRTLRPYDQLPGGDKVFQLEEIFDHFENRFFTNDFSQPNILDPDQSPNLVDIYSDQVREITAAIVDHLIVEPPEQTQTLNVELTGEELERLNAWDDNLGENPDGNLVINLVERGGLFDQRQENLRIASLRVHTMDVRPAAGLPPANVTVFVRHSGESRISSRGEAYSFNHYRTLKQSSIAWRGIYDRIEGRHSSPELSAASNSLLETLLGGLDGEQVPRDLLLYSRPSAWADLVISKETLGGGEMLIDRLVLQLEVDFSEKAPRAELHLSAAGTDGEPLVPNILLSLSDENLRSDGRGSFQRFFQPGESVDLLAHEVYGGYVFDRWIDSRGNTVSNEPFLSLDLPFGLSATASRFRALYRYSPGSTGSGTLFRRGDINTDGRVDISDPIALLSGLFTGGRLPACRKAADSNDDGRMDISDAITILDVLFTGQASIPAPRGVCGFDPTPDELTCESSGPCE